MYTYISKFDAFSAFRAELDLALDGAILVIHRELVVVAGGIALHSEASNCKACIIVTRSQ
jgi:hypothetical protein